MAFSLVSGHDPSTTKHRNLNKGECTWTVISEWMFTQQPPSRKAMAVESCTAGVLSAKGRRHLIIEEGTHSNWLYEILSPHVHEMIVIGVPRNKGQKNDKLDSFGLAAYSAEIDHQNRSIEIT